MNQFTYQITYPAKNDLKISLYVYQGSDFFYILFILLVHPNEKCINIIENNFPLFAMKYRK